MSNVTAIRAVTAHAARRFMRQATIIVLSLFGILILLCALLAYFFSAWWWLLTIPFLFLLGLLIIIRLVLRVIISQIHHGQLNSKQRHAVDRFTDKLERLIEARGTPLPFFIMISIKDLLIHRDLTTAKEIVRDTTTLRRDFNELRSLFE